MRSSKQKRVELTEARRKRREAEDEIGRARQRREMEREIARGGPMNPEFLGLPRPDPEDYQDYAVHPRYGKAPRYTGVDPDPDQPFVRLHFNTGYYTNRELRIWAESEFPFTPSRIPSLVPGTAIAADVEKQVHATQTVTHYYDLDLLCGTCGKRYIFFAEEQQHWYEDLQFDLASRPVDCTTCRKAKQNTRQIVARYSQLLGMETRTDAETLELASCCLALVRVGEFSENSLRTVRRMLNLTPEELRQGEAYLSIKAELDGMTGRR